jgi:hypothetical protein
LEERTPASEDVEVAMITEVVDVFAVAVGAEIGSASLPTQAPVLLLSPACLLVLLWPAGRCPSQRDDTVRGAAGVMSTPPCSKKTPPGPISS